MYREKLDEIAEQVQDKVCTFDNNKYNCQPHPCTTTTWYCRSKSLLVMTLMVSTTIYGATMWCRDVANNYTCYRQLYRLVPVLFTSVQQFTQLVLVILHLFNSVHLILLFLACFYCSILGYIDYTVDTQCYLSVGIIYSH